MAVRMVNFLVRRHVIDILFHLVFPLKGGEEKKNREELQKLLILNIKQVKQRIHTSTSL